MTPERAHHLLRPLSVTADDLRVESRSDKYGGAWVVFAALGTEQKPVTQSRNVGVLCRWVARYRSLG